MNDLGVSVTADYVLAALGPRPCRLLDAGCGDGALAAVLRAEGHDVVAIDAMSSSRSEFAFHEPIEVADLMTFSDHPFDAVVLSRSLHHMSRLGDAVLAINRLLRYQGLLIIEEFASEAADHATAAWFYSIDDYLREFGICDRGASSCGEPTRALQRWLHEHAHSPRLHTSDEMLASIHGTFTVMSAERGPYLYRYWSRSLSTSPGLLALAQSLLQLERSLIDCGAIVPMGVRVVAKKETTE